MKRSWKQDLDGFQSLEYVKLLGVPMRSSRQGPLVDLKPLFLDRLVARAVLSSRNPIRGKEVRFLRKTAELSLDKLARRLGLTASAIYYWEKAEENRLITVNEIAVKTFFAEEFSVETSGRFSDLIGSPAQESVTLEITRSRKPYKPRQKAATQNSGSGSQDRFPRNHAAATEL